MQKYSVAVILVFMILFFYTAPLSADLIVMKNGDKLFGKIQNKHFALYSPYGQIVCGYDFLKKITFDENKPAHGSFQSINNDRFSGFILVDGYHIILETGEEKSISKNNIQRIRIDRPGPSYKISTVVFTMQNNDKFSGKMLTADFKVKAGHMVRLIRGDAINRIEIPAAGHNNARILLNNGDLISGELQVEQIDVASDSIGPITIGKSAISSIQFNADKMVLSQYYNLPESDRDSDGDGIADDKDKCPGSSWGFEVDENGCSKDPNLTKGGNPFDQDSDGVLNDLDQCPNTPQGVPVDLHGCSAIKPVFFEFDKYDLQRKFYADLDIVVFMLKKNPSMNIQIQGHTDNVGSPEYNMELSEKRAKAIKSYLTNKGIDAQRISIIGYGDTKNEAPNNTPSGRAQNRRAVIVVLK